MEKWTITYDHLTEEQAQQLSAYYAATVTMSKEKLDQIEQDVKKVLALFPNDYGCMKAIELIAELRRWVT